MFVDQFWHHIKDDDDEKEGRWKSGSRFINIRCLRFFWRFPQNFTQMVDANGCGNDKCKFLKTGLNTTIASKI
jgi:hypothetical protein